MANQQDNNKRDALSAVFQPRKPFANEPKTSAIDNATAPRTPPATDLESIRRQAYEEARAKRATRPATGPRPGQNTSGFQDVGTALEIGARQIPGILSGVGDIVAGASPLGLLGVNRPVSRLSDFVGDAIGIDNDAPLANLEQEFSPASQAARNAVGEAQGFLDTTKAFIENPRAIGLSVAESIPSTLAGGGIGGAIAKTAAARVAAGSTNRVTNALANRAVAAGAGEGIVAAGSTMQGIDESVGPFRAAIASLGAGAATGVLGAVGAKVANKLGIGDPDLIFVGNRPTLAPGVKPRGIIKRMAFGAASEALQEMPQSGSETMFQNWAEDKPLFEGVPNAMVSGLFAGMGMGAGAGAINIGGPRAADPEPTPEREDAATDEDTAAPTDRLQQISDSQLIKNLAVMGTFFEEAANDEQRAIIKKNLLRGQQEFRRRGLSDKLMEEESAQAEFDKIAARLEKNQRLTKGLAAVDVEKAEQMEAMVDADVDRLIQIERVYPGARNRNVDTKFADKYADLREAQKRVEKNRSKKSRASKASREKNLNELKGIIIELEEMVAGNPEAAARLEQTLLAQEEFNPAELVGQQIPVGGPVIPDIEILPSEQQAAREAETTEGEAAAPVTNEGASTDQPVADVEPENQTSKQERSLLERILKAGQSTTGLGPEPSALPLEPVPERIRGEDALMNFAGRVTDTAARKFYINKNGTINKNAKKDLVKFTEEMGIGGLLSTLDEYAALPEKKRKPKVRAQEELIQDILATTRREEYDAYLERNVEEQARQEPLTQAEMENILLEAQNTGTHKDNLTPNQLLLLESWARHRADGRDDPMPYVVADVWRDRRSKNGSKALPPDAGDLRKQLKKASDKIVAVVKKRRNLRTRREAELYLGKDFFGFETKTQRGDTTRDAVLATAKRTGTPEDVAIAEQRDEFMRDGEERGGLQLDVQTGSSRRNDAPGGNADLLATPGEGDPFLNKVITQELEEGLIGLRGDLRPKDSLSETPREPSQVKRVQKDIDRVLKAAGDLRRERVEQDVKKGKRKKAIAEAEGATTLLKAMGLFNIKPRQKDRLNKLLGLKDSAQQDIDRFRTQLGMLEAMGDAIPTYHARPDFDALGAVWNRVRKMYKESTGKKAPTWKKVQHDPIVLDRWFSFNNAIAVDNPQQAGESDTDYLKRLLPDYQDALGAAVDERVINGSWDERVERKQEELEDTVEAFNNLIQQENELFAQLGAQAEALADYENVPITAGPAPRIYYGRRTNERITPAVPPTRKTTKTKSGPEDSGQTLSQMAKQATERAQGIVEPHASVFSSTEFAAGSERSYSPDSEVAAIFADPATSAAEGVHAVIYTGKVDDFLKRAARVIAKVEGVSQEDALDAIKSLNYSNAKAALDGGQKLTAPTINRRTGAVRGIEHVLASIESGNNTVQFVEVLNGQQLAASEKELSKSRMWQGRTVTSEVIAEAPKQTKPAKKPERKAKKTTATPVVMEGVTTIDEFITMAAKMLAKKNKGTTVESQREKLLSMDLTEARRQRERGITVPAPIIDFRTGQVRFLDHVLATGQALDLDTMFRVAAYERSAGTIGQTLGFKDNPNLAKVDFVKPSVLFTPAAKLRMSVAQQPVREPETSESIAAAINKYVPQGRRDAVRVVQSLNELGSLLARDNISVSATAGGFTYKGKVYLIADNIQKGAAGGILMHEVGVHMSLKPAMITRLSKAITDMANAGDELAISALDAVDAATDTMAGHGEMVSDFDVAHEVVAYYVENAVRSGIDPTQLGSQPGPIQKFFRNLMTQIRASLRALGLSGRALTAQDVVDAAYGASDTVFRRQVNNDNAVRMSDQQVDQGNKVKRAAAAWINEKPAANRAWANLKYYTRRVGQTFLFSHDFVDLASDSLPSARDYFNIVARRVAARGRFDAEMQHHKNKANQFTKDEYNQLNDFFVRTQQLEAWGFEPHEGAFKPEKKDPELQKMFRKLSADQQAYVRETFAFADQLQHKREAALRSEIEEATNDVAMREPDPEKRQALLDKARADLAKFDREFAGRRVAWLPLRRYGAHASTFISDELRAEMDIDPSSEIVRQLKADGSHYIVEFHATPGRAAEAQKHYEATATRPGSAERFPRATLASRTELIPANMMNAIRAKLEGFEGKERDGLMKAWTNHYIEQLAETSVRKSELERSFVEGFDRDMIKNFITYGSQVGGTISAIEMGRETHASIQAMRAEAGPRSDSSVPRDVRQTILLEVLERHQQMLEPTDTPITDKVMGATSLNLLLSSPAYFLQNSTQPWLMTLPIIGGNFGMGLTASQMSKNYGVMSKAWKAEHSFAPGKLSQLLSGELADLELVRKEVGDEAAGMLQELQDLGLFDIGIAADLGSLDNEQSFPLSQAIAKAHRGATHAVRTVEVFNRGVTALTAFQLAKKFPNKIPLGPNGKRFTPQEYAVHQVMLTQGDYSGHNAPSIIRRGGWPAKLMTQFRKFQLIQIGLLLRTGYTMFGGAGPYEKAMAKRQFAYLIGAHGLAAGGLGLPMASLASLAFSMFGDEDEPEDLEVLLRREIGDEAVADLLLKGLPAFWGVDVSGKVGMGQTFSVMPFTDVRMDRTGFYEAMGTLMLGASGATGAQLVDAGGQLMNGNVAEGIVGAMPRGLRDLGRAVMYNAEGMRKRNPTRDVTLSAEELDGLDIFMQAVGLPTTTITGAKSRNRFYQNYKRQLSERSSTVQAAYVDAYEARDMAGMREARNDWNELQKSRVANGFTRQPTSLLNRAVRRKRDREREAVDGVIVDKSGRGFVDMLK